LLGGNGAVTAMVTGLGDVDLELFGGGLGEEALGAVEQFVDSRSADRVALDVEEPPLAAGEVDLIGDCLPGDLVGALERGDVDDGKAVHGIVLKVTQTGER